MNLERLEQLLGGLTDTERTAWRDIQRREATDQEYERTLRRDGMLPGDLDAAAAARTRAAAEERHRRLERDRRY